MGSRLGAHESAPVLAEAAPLLVMLHGAGSSGQAMVDLVGGAAREHGLLLVAPDAVGRTWDLMEGGFGPDVERLDALLAEVHAQTPVARTVLGGFSDGASYALSLGLANGDRFSNLVAFSPGFVAPGATLGRPRVYVSHGRDDRVLPIDRCSRRIVPSLRRAGYQVEYHEFDGGHGVPAEIVGEALAWAAGA